MLPCFLAFFISISRVVDHSHHSSDVIVGIVIGSLIGYICYNYFYKKRILENIKLNKDKSNNLLKDENKDTNSRKICESD